MGKWDFVKGKFEPFVDMKYGAKLDAVREMYAAFDLKDLLREMHIKRTRQKELDEELSILNLEVEGISQLLMANMEANGVRLLNSDEGYTFYVTVEPYTSVSDRELLNKIIDANPELHHIRGINWQSANSYNKEKLEAGHDSELLPGTTVFLKTSVRMRKS